MPRLLRGWTTEKGSEHSEVEEVDVVVGVEVKAAAPAAAAGRALAERLRDPEMRFPNPVVAEMIPRIIAALLE